ncbi:MAG TPA: Xaa-Pro peptidase family protein, partial [Bryobacteraceae bacterium]|nr:Xaa-Pro peptidase family protein [Bryobacteraceae bacterium]
IRNLRPMTAGIQPITGDERRARIEKARKLMRENKIGAVLMEGGSSAFYFTGSRSDGVFVLPSQGEILSVTREYRAIANALKDSGAATGRVGIEERVHFDVVDGLSKLAPALEFVSADPVTAGCRVIKSPAEIALMQRANDITIAAYRAALSSLKEGMTQRELSANIGAAYQALGVQGEAMASFGKYTAFPHGSIEPQKLQEGDFVLIDDGCRVEGYQSDVTRTVIFGKPTARQREIWALERKAQDAALAAAKPGATCESVDAAARKVITDAGFGPGYKVPGLPHRTGHGIGLDGHEWTYLVRGNRTRLQPGMCFSDEPMIAIYGEFGVRLEDCMYITEDGARTFTKQSPAIDQPFG